MASIKQHTINISLVAILGGWLAACFVCWTIALIVYRDLGATFFVLLFFAPISAIMIFPIWLCVVVPLIYLVPDSSPIYRPLYLTVCGLLAGPLLVGLELPIAAIISREGFAWEDVPDSLIYTGVPATLVGGFTCLVGSILRRRLILTGDAWLFRPPKR